jgi:serine/threonine protein kinase/tetratricopeptide (TPR) repeat protein
LTVTADGSVPEIIGEHYVVERELGRGGMCTVYLCTDRRNNTHVAVKILRQEIGSKVVIDRFLREIAYSAELDHPRIPKVLDSGVIGDLPYYVMTYIAGESLRTRLERERQLPISEAIEIACNVIGPTSYAHDRGIVHRDIKPENILLSPEGVYVLDFGIARAIVESGVDRLTSTGVGVGTPAYMSPEQATGDRQIDGRSDVYSIGCVLYEMIAGMPPFVGPTAQIIISRRFAAPPPPLSEFRERVPAWLDTIVSRALARSPADRWASVDDLSKALKNPSSVEKTMIVSKASRLWQRGSVRALAGLTAIGAVALAATLSRDRPPAAPIESSGLGRVVVAPLENRTGNKSLDIVGVMAGDWITEGLQKTGFVQVVPTATALQAARYVASRSTSGDSREPLRALAAETGAGTVVGGAYYRQGDRILFRVDVADQGGRRLVRALTDVAAPASDPMQGVEELRNRLMGWLALKYDDRLQGATPEGDQPPTYAAYQTFSEGMTRYVAVDNTQALPLFLRAFKLDSSFTVALLYASLASTNLALWASADSLLKEVNDRRQGLSEYNRAWLDYRIAFIHGDHETALSAIRLAAKQAPQSKATYNHALQAYYAGHLQEALTAMQALPAERGPMRGFAGYAGVYCEILHAVGLYDREYAVGEAARKAYPDRLTKFLALVRALSAKGQLVTLATTVRAAQGIPTDPTAWDYGRILAEAAEELGAHGHPDSAAVYFEQLRQWLTANNNSLEAGPRLVRTLYSLGRYEEARRQLVSLRRKFPRDIEYLGMTGLLYAMTGKGNSARLVADSVAQLRGSYQFGIGGLYRARIAAAMGDRDGAVARLREAFAQGLPYGVELHRDIDFKSLRGYPPFEQLVRGKD